MNPLLQALRSLGGSGTIEEINNKVAEIADFTDDQLELLHNSDKNDGRTEIEYRLAWARTYLKRAGLLENSTRGVWALTAAGNKVDQVDPKEINRNVQAEHKKARQAIEEDEEAPEIVNWKTELRETLLKMLPAAFERLVQRMLRESGFTQVEVTGQSGDGGIDGKGLLRLGGFLSFHVIFQCKRWQGSVSSSTIRDFRGAMVGRADKGLLITTGNFTKDAVKEASRDGAPAIDLIDGDQFLEKLKELGLGVATRKVEVEEIAVNHEWFANI